MIIHIPQTILDEMRLAHDGWKAGIISDRQFVEQCGKIAKQWAQERVNAYHMAKELIKKDLNEEGDN